MGSEAVVGQGVVVTGTDTGAGKTVVAAALAALWRARGDDVTYVKPVQSGTAHGDDDAATVGWLTGATAVTGPRVGPALAPGVAARLVGADLVGGALVESVRAAARPPSRPIVEGAGGLLVELGSDGTTLADVARELGLPLLVVARPVLGTLNHSALTVEAILRRGLGFVGVVVDRYPPDPDLASRTNLYELDRITGGRLVGVVPELDLQRPDVFAPCAGWFGPELGGSWVKETVLARLGGSADGWRGTARDLNGTA